MGQVEIGRGLDFPGLCKKNLKQAPLKIFEECYTRRKKRNADSNNYR